MAVDQNQDPTYQATAGDQVATPTNAPAPTLPAGWQAQGGMMYNPSIQLPAGVTSGAQIGRDVLPNYVNIKPLPQTQSILDAIYQGLRYGTPLPEGMTEHSLQAKGGISQQDQFGSYVPNAIQPSIPNTQFPTNPNPPMNTTQPVPGSPAPVNPNPAPRDYTGPQIGSTPPVPGQIPPEIHQSLQTIQNFLAANPHLAPALLGNIPQQTFQNSMASFAPQTQQGNKQKQKPQGALDLLRSIYGRGDTSNPTTQVR